MKVGFLSDAHGNVDGLRLCLAELEALGVDRLFFLGDAVGYFPDGAEVIELLRAADAHCLCGNHEAMLLGRLAAPPEVEEAYRIQEASLSLGVEQKREIATWSTSERVSLDGYRLLLVHGSPENPLCGHVYPDSDLSSFEELEVDAVFLGHTHRPFISSSGRAMVVNVGSCGLPRDHGRGPSIAVFDSQTGDASLLRPIWAREKIIEKYRGRVHPHVIEVLRR